MQRAIGSAAVVLCLVGVVSAQTPAGKSMAFPIIPKFGGVVPVPNAAEPPRKGAKVVFDITADAKPAVVNKGLERVARLLNLYGAFGLKAADVTIAVVLHGEATKSVLKRDVYNEKFATSENPNLPLIAALREAGVEVYVCGQALAYKEYEPTEVVDGVKVAAAALTVLINKQADGFSYVPAH
ncbi:DsrE family protein [Singulisphaera sp. PoT]|uniref:DsrE family protein n=1 Tax=Singulisphaera sp. PoT TaxID=3411797 RepID=UPI003BF575F8